MGSDTHLRRCQTPMEPSGSLESFGVGAVNEVRHAPSAEPDPHGSFRPPREQHTPQQLEVLEEDFGAVVFAGAWEIGNDGAQDLVGARLIPALGICQTQVVEDLGHHLIR